MVEDKDEWDIETANRVYNIDRWGIGYFYADDSGHLIASPLQDDKQTIKIMDVIEEAKAMGLRFPLQIRFQDLLRHRVMELNRVFRQAISERNYHSKYMGVFPIKVNQMREVVEEIVDAGKPFNFGIEAGSKPELLAALSLHTDYDSLIICNGYKDHSFIKHALAGNRLGKKVIMVAEKLEEIRMIVQVSQEMKIDPIIGIRIRLATKSSGKWATSSGENAKFGLSTSDILEAIHILKAANLEHSLKLVHFHIGSQIPDIKVINKAVTEGARYYAKLVKHGCQLEYIDVGGGLGVDYDGSKSDFPSSINYSLQEYANGIIYTIADVCDDENVPHPNIISESGRAIVAHHSMIVVEAFGKIEKRKKSSFLKLDEKSHKLVNKMIDVKNQLPKASANESLHDLMDIKEEAQSLFVLGYLDLDSKAMIDTLYWEISAEIVQRFKSAEEYIPDEIKEMDTALSDQYLCNFSVFQSIPDYWALGQLFPITPLHRLNEKPESKATLVDITCDSDGKINKFIDLVDINDTLPLHNVNGDPYYLGIFMTGAYQDVMGDLHNLFGRINEVHVFLDPDEDLGWYIEETIDGSTISEVLAMNMYTAGDLAKGMKVQVDAAIKNDRVKPSEGMRLLAEYEKGLLDYTYLKSK